MRALRRELRLQHLAERALPVLRDAIRHRVEDARELRDLVAAAHRRAHREVAAAELLDGLAEHRERPQQRASRARPRAKSPSASAAATRSHRRADALRLAPRALALERHRVLVDRQDALAALLGARSAGAARGSSRPARRGPRGRRGMPRGAPGTPATARAARVTSSAFAGLGDVAFLDAQLPLEASLRCRVARAPCSRCARWRRSSASSSMRSSVSFMRCAASTLR